MSKKTEMNPEEMIVDNRGIREIADTLRRGTRMSPKQFRFSVFIATALILLLILLIIVAQSRATYILKVNESSDVMREAMNAERIELTNKLQLTDRYGTATVDGKHLYVLQEVGQQTGKDSDKLYWLVYCSEEESADYAAAMKSYKQLIPVIQDRASLSDAVEQIKTGTRNYARRQLIWFRRDKRIRWIASDRLPQAKEEIIRSWEDPASWTSND